MDKLVGTHELTLAEQLLWDDICADFSAVADEEARNYYQGLFSVFSRSQVLASSEIKMPNMDNLGADIGLVDASMVEIEDDPLETLSESFNDFLGKRGKLRFFQNIQVDEALADELYFDQREEIYDEDFSGLSSANKEGVQILKLEIQDRDRFECSAIQFAFIIQHLKQLVVAYKKLKPEKRAAFDWWSTVPERIRSVDGEEFKPVNFRNFFRAGLTDHGSDFIDQVDDIEIRRSILSSLENSVDESNDPEEEPIDVRIWDHLTRVKWYLDKFNLPSIHQDIVFKVLLKMEPPYRDRMRNKEVSQSDPSRPEPHFSHFLRVLRIGLGLIDAVRKKNYHLSGDLAVMFDDLYTDEAQTQLDPDKLLSYCVELLTHDLEEDFKITGVDSKQGVEKFLRPLIRSDYAKKNELIKRVAETSHALNSKNYDSREQCLRVLRSDITLARLKLSDMLQNHSSPYTDKIEKLRMYANRFLARFCAQGLAHVTPDRLMISSLAQNPVLPEAGVVWRKVSETLASAYDETNMADLANTLGIPIAYSRAEAFY